MDMQTDLALRDVMTREFVGVSESDSLLGATRLLREESARTAIVLRGQEPVGLVSGEEVVAFLADGGDPSAATVSEVMSDPPETLSPDDSLRAAATRLVEGDVGDLLVTASGSVVGTVDARDLVAASASQAPAETFAAGPADRRSNPATASEYSTQSICESCGSLTRELVDVNGQLLCANCRNV